MDHSEPKKKLQTDVSRRAALPTGSLFNRNQQQTEVAVNSETYLANIEEEWNKKIDAEVEVLVDGMVDLVEIASVGSCLE
jgi:mediator of RNA polymerase II transcription subunit 22